MIMRSFLEKNKILDFINEYEMIEKGDGIVVGLSGGPDSVCLLLLLKEIRDEYQLNIKAVHVHHGIRKYTADRDEDFCKALCESLKIDFSAYHIDAVSLAKDKSCPVEEAARLARYDIFREEADSLSEKCKSVKIAIAHNSDDNLETVLLHMTRGCGLSGLCGISPVRDQIIRPLLRVRKSDITEYLQENHIAYCTDETNEDSAYSRNKIRNEISPLLNEVNSKTNEHVTSMCEGLAQINEFLISSATSVIKDGVVRIDDLIRLPQVLRQICIKEYLSSFMPEKKDVSKSHIDSVLEMVGASEERYIDLPFEYRAVINSKEIHVEHKPDRVLDVVRLSKIECQQFDIADVDPDIYRNSSNSSYTKWVDCDKIIGNLCVRTRKDGDYMTIKNGRKLLSDILKDAKIPRSERDSIPLVCDGSHVIWMVGYRISECVKITDDTKEVLKINYKKEEENG